jgi:NAD-dependent dihydropyrimidine dehydrogenase PreA subunit
VKTIRAMVEIDEAKCDGCGECVPSCHEGAIKIIDGKARLVADSLCDGLGACLGECPQGAIRIVQREADPFVPPPHLADAPRPRPVLPPAAPATGGCPGSRMQRIRPLPALGARPAGAPAAASDSALSHWPVQIGLVPPHAPFLEDAELLVAADCVPVAYPGFHADLLAGRAVMIGCPKFDDGDAYVERFRALFDRGSVTKVVVAVMEVPCCHALPRMVLAGRARAGSETPVELAVVGVDGTMRGRQAL